MGKKKTIKNKYVYQPHFRMSLEEMEQKINRVSASSNSTPIEGDLTNAVFGKLKVIKQNGPLWLCQCKCTNLISVSAKDLLGKKYVNCKHAYCVFNKPLPTVDEAIENLIKHYKANAKDRGRKYKLSTKQFKALIFDTCFYCGCAPFRPLRSRETVYRNGIDRVDNNKGYIPGNVVSCCWPCNTQKGARDDQSAKQTISQAKNDIYFAKKWIKASAKAKQKLKRRKRGSKK